MRSLVLVLVAAVTVAVVACGKKPDPGAGSAGASPAVVSHGEAALAKMSELRDQACACKTKLCADGVSAAVRQWSADDLKANGPLTYTDEQSERIVKIAGDLGTCVEHAISPPHPEHGPE
ncbi:MAG: hypothetical protein ABI591_19960 [Kofleriaceae bacterium]